MGAVFVGVHRATGARRAVKTLQPEALSSGAEEQERFRREALAMARLDHPNLVTVHTAELDGPTPYLVQDLLEGGSLHDRLKRGPFPIDEAVEITRQLAAGLGHAHEHGVLHRDLKPHNVVFDAEGRPVVVDFGLARLSAEQRMTQTGAVLGTPAYMAPEQASGLGEVDARTDVYGLGAVLYALLTGGAPFAGGGLYATLDRVLHKPPAPPSAARPEVPAGVERVCLRALEKDPDARFASMEAFGAALEGCRNVAGRGSARSPRVAWAGGLVVAGLLLAGAVAWEPGSAELPPARPPPPSPPRSSAHDEAPEPAPPPPALRVSWSEAPDWQLTSPSQTGRPEAYVAFAAERRVIVAAGSGAVRVWTLSESGGGTPGAVALPRNTRRDFDVDGVSGWRGTWLLVGRAGEPGESMHAAHWAEGQDVEALHPLGGSRLFLCSASRGTDTVAVGVGREVRLLSGPNGQEERRPFGGDLDVCALAWSPTGTLAAMVGPDLEGRRGKLGSEVHTWTTSPSPGWDLLCEAPVGRAMTYLPDGALLVADNVGAISRLPRGAAPEKPLEKVADLSGPAVVNSSLAFAGGRLYGVGTSLFGQRQSLRVWDYRDGDLSLVANLELPEKPTTLALSPDGRLVAVGLENRKVFVWRTWE
jgi:serine/threonine protein kinase